MECVFCLCFFEPVNNCGSYVFNYCSRMFCCSNKKFFVCVKRDLLYVNVRSGEFRHVFFLVINKDELFVAELAG